MDSLLYNVAGLRLSESDAVSEADAPGSTITGPSHQPNASINDLPPEILLEIFLFCGLSHKKRRKHKLLEATLRIGGVCRRWRKISLTCSDMWARCFDMVEHSPTTLKMILQRVKNRGIDFVLPPLRTFIHPRTGQIVWPSTIDYWKDALYSDFKLLNKAMFRSRSLSAPLTTNDGNILQWWPIKRRLPQLDELHLKLTNTRECLMLDHNGLYDENAEPSWNMRSLTLVRCFFPFLPRFFSSLRELSITGLDNSNVALTPQSWLDILAELTQLRRLELHDAMTETPAAESNEDIDPQPWSGAISDVCLPLLESLNIGSEFNSCSELLSRLVVPSSCDIFIFVHSLWEMCTSAFSSMTSWIQTRFSKDEPTLGNSLFTMMSGRAVAIRNTKSPIFNFQADFSPEYNAEGNVVHNAGFTPDELFQALVEPLALPCAYITELKLLIDCEYDATEHQNFCAQAFSSFVAVESLSLLSHDSFCFMVPICDTGGFVEIYHLELREWILESMALFPKLQTLSSRDVNFIDPVSDSDNVNLGKRLLNLVERRRGAYLRGLVSDIKKIDIDKGRRPVRKDCLKMASYGVAVAVKAR